MNKIAIYIIAGLGALILGYAVGQFGWLVAAAVVGLALLLPLLSRPRVLLLLLMISVVFGQFGRIPPASASSALLVTDLLAGLLFFLWLLWFIAHPRAKDPVEKPTPIPKALYLWLGFLAIGAITLVLNPIGIAKRELLTNAAYLARLVSYTALAWIIPALFKGPQASRTLIRWLIAMTMGVVFLGFVQLFLLPNIGVLAKYGWDPHVGRLVSSFLDPNFLGGFLAMGAALLAAILTTRPERKMANWLWFCLIVLLGAAVLTYSRSGYLAVLIVVAIAGLRYSWKLLLIACCVLPLALFIPRVQQRISGGFAIDQTAQDRIDSWYNAASIFQAYPWFGIGYNNYRTAQESLGLLNSGSTTRAGGGSDSSTINVLVTTGVLGLALFIAAICGVMVDAWRRLRGKHGKEQEVFAATLLVAIPALLVHSWFVNGLFYPFILLFLSLLVGGLYIGGKKDDPLT